MHKRSFVLVIALLVVVAGCSDDDSPTKTPAPFPAFSDTFDDGSIDTGVWEVGGDIAEAGGYLQLRRDGTEDYIQSSRTYTGDWVVELEIRLNEIHWHDTFHGISLRDEDGSGITFGFSRYGKLFLAEHDETSGTGFSYGPDDSNRPGEWQVWTLTRIAGELTVLVDGAPVAGLTASPVPDDVYIHLPGMYQDGDGGAGTNTTSSDVTSISIDEAP